MKTITVELPWEAVAELYLKLESGKVYIYTVREWNKNGAEWHVVEVTNNRPGGLLFVHQMNGARVKEQFLSWDTIFGLAGLIERIVAGGYVPTLDDESRRALYGDNDRIALEKCRENESINRELMKQASEKMEEMRGELEGLRMFNKERLARLRKAREALSDLDGVLDDHE